MTASYPPWIGLFLVFAVLLCLPPHPVSAQQQLTDAELHGGMPASSEVTVTLIENRLEALKQKTELDSDLRAQVESQYREALEWARQADAWMRQADRFQRERRETPSQLKVLQKELTEPPEVALDLPDSPTSSQIEQLLTQTEADLLSAQRRLAELEAEPRRRADRRLEIAPTMAEARSRLSEIAQSAKEIVIPPGEHPELTRAKRINGLAQQRALQEQIRALEEEQLSYDARTELLTARQERAARQVSQLKKHLATLRSLLTDLRRQESQEAVGQARQERREELEAAHNHSVIKQLAEENIRLIQERVGETGPISKLEEAGQRLTEIDQELSALVENFRGVRERVQAVKDAGLNRNNAIGLILQRQREKLPDIGFHQKELRLRQEVISRTHLDLIHYQDERANLVDVTAQVETIARKLDPQLSQWEQENILDSARRLLLSKREYLNALIKDLDTYFNTLMRIESQQRSLIKQTRQFSDYINQRVFWIRNVKEIGLSDARAEAQAVRETLVQGPWGELARQVKDYARQNPFWLALYGAVLAGLFGLRRKLPGRLEELGQQATKSLNTSFAITVEAFVHTLLLALFWPLLIASVGWIFAHAAPDSVFVRSLGRSLQIVGVAYLTMEFYRQVCRPRGLAVCHFTWAQSNADLMARNLRWLMLLGLPLTFLSSFLENQGQEAINGRVAFILGMIAVAWFAHRLLSRKTGLRSPTSNQREAFQTIPLGGRLVYLVGVTAPIALATLSALGYHFTALQLTWRLLATLWLALGVLVVNALVLRWFFIARRRLAIRQNRNKRAAQAEGESEPLPKEGLAPSSAELEEIDLSTVNLQTKRLLRSFTLVALFVGAWAVWIDVLPALTWLERVPLWPNAAESQTASGSGSTSGSQNPLLNPRMSASQGLTGTTTPTAPGSAPAAATPAESGSDPVLPDASLADLALAILIVLMTIIAAKNLPGLLETTILPRFQLKRGGAYAITTVLRYIITLVGVITAFSLIGITWSKIQWLAAAIMLGIGFGLQEIVANFVSGLIILYERPIRLGDIITVGDLSGNGLTGTVTKIEIRATTITNWDNQEYLVPNKEFITGRLMNWTLTDSINRLVFTVGIAYGSDTTLTHDLLLKVANDNPRVLKDPPPTAVFNAFGESSLEFHLRVYIPNVDYLIVVRHEINTAIEKAFREAGIVIAYPQRDLHIKSAPPNFLRESQAPTSNERPHALNAPESSNASESPAARR